MRLFYFFSPPGSLDAGADFSRMIDAVDFTGLSKQIYSRYAALIRENLIKEA